MMTSSNGNIFRVTGPLCGEFTGPGEFPTQRPVTRSFDVYFDLCPDKRLGKQLWGWWFETLSHSLWRHRNVLVQTNFGNWIFIGHLSTSTDQNIIIYTILIHSVESPSMVDPQWNIWYWGSKWNLHTVCWSAVGCEWGTTSVYFGITCVCFIPSRLPVFAVEPQYLLQYFLFLS